MTDITLLILAALLLILIVAIIGIVLLLYLYFSLRSQFSDRVARERDYWKDASRKEAQQQLVVWRQQELESSKKQQLEFARSEALVHLERWKQDQEQVIRQDAIQRSQSVTVGKITEHLVPYLPGFNFNPKDVRFVGSPIDLIIFDGLSDGEVQRVVFVEVKTGSSSLSTRERRIRDAIQAGRIEWIEFRPSVDVNAEMVK